MKTLASTASLSLLLLSCYAFALRPDVKHFEYKCKMACGELSIGGLGNCRGVQISGSLTKDAKGVWTAEETEFVFSPHKLEYFRAISCPAYAKAEVSILPGDAIYISFDEGTYRPPMTCPDGSSIQLGFNDKTRKSALFLRIRDYDNQNHKYIWSSLASVEHSTSWPRNDFTPDCDVSNISW